MAQEQGNEAEPYLDLKKINDRLLRLSMKTGYNCIQRNGQRYYGPPPNWIGLPPGKGSEIFVGRLPRDCFEDELVPVLESVATLYEVRMMMNFTGFNRGFAFVTYCNPQDAWKAVLTLNEYEIRPGRRLGISKSTDNCRLYFGGIPTDKNKSEAWEELMKISTIIQDVIMYPNPVDHTKNRGYMFVEFESHRCAAMIKRSLVPGTVRLWGQEIIVDWAHPEIDVDPQIMATITKLFIRNLRPSTNGEEFYRFLQKIVPSYAILRLYIAGHYGFIHFDTREHAQLAKDRLSITCFEGEELEVHWARPKFCSKVNQKRTPVVAPRFHRQEHLQAWGASETTHAPLFHQQPIPDVIPHSVQMSEIDIRSQMPPVVNYIPQIVPQVMQHSVLSQPMQIQDSNNNARNHEPVLQHLAYGYQQNPVVLYAQNPYSFFTQ